MCGRETALRHKDNLDQREAAAASKVDVPQGSSTKIKWDSKTEETGRLMVEQSNAQVEVSGKCHPQQVGNLQ